MESTVFRHRSDALPGVVASCVAYETHDAPVGSHRGLPSPWLTFIVSVDAPVRVGGTIEDSDRLDLTQASSYDVLLAGLHPAAVWVEQPRDQAGVQLAIHPLAAPGLFGCRAAELGARGEHGDAVLGAVARVLHERVGSDPDASTRLDVLQHWVRQQHDAARSRVRPELWEAWRLIASNRGRCRVEDLARDVALSARQLRSLMLAELGVSPKQLCRLFRLDHVVETLARNSTAPETASRSWLADLAERSGHVDQSHLNREFRRMVGCSPTQWLAEERRNIQDGGHRNRADSSP